MTLVSSVLTEHETLWDIPHTIYIKSEYLPEVWEGIAERFEWMWSFRHCIYLIVYSSIIRCSTQPRDRYKKFVGSE